MVPKVPAPSGSFTDSYLQYKADTNFFTTWLANIGQKCGYRLSLPDDKKEPQPASSAPKTAPRLKGKERKLKKQAAKKDPEDEPSSQKPAANSLLLRDFIPIAKRIASSSSPKVVIPRPVVKKLERAINLRHRFASRFEVSVQETASLASNQTHQHFIKVLETALTILKPLCENTASSYPPKATVSDDVEGVPDHELLARLENRFQSLAVETEEEEEEEDIEVLVQLSKHGKAGKTLPAKTTNFVPEQQSRDDDYMLGCFCFFQDLQEIRRLLQDLWQRYQQKKVTLVVASLVTNTAIDYVRLADETFRSRFIESQSEDYYDCFVDKMFRRTCQIQGHPYLADKGKLFQELGSADVQIYVDEMAEDADFIMLPCWQVLKYGMDHSERIPGGKRIEEVPHLLTSYMGQVWAGHTSSAPSVGRLHQHRLNARILQLGLCGHRSTVDELAPDNFMRGVRERAQAPTQPAWLVFAAQNYLDIHQILKGDFSRSFDELQSTCEMVRQRIQRPLDLLPPQGVGVAHFSDADDYTRLNDFRDTFFPDFFEPSQDAFRVNPVGAGVRLLAYLGWCRHTCLVSSRVPDIVGAAYIYQAARLHSHCAVWPDMEFIIASQKPEHIFFGGRPTSLAETWKKMDLAMGYSICSTVWNERTGDRVRRPGGVRGLKIPEPPFTYTIFTRAPETVIDDHHIAKSLANLELLALATSQGIDRSKFKMDLNGLLLDRAELLKLTSKRTSKNSGTASTTITLPTLLTILEQNLTVEQPELYFDYWTFRTACSALINDMFARVYPRWSRISSTSLADNPQRINLALAGYLLSSAKWSMEVGALTGDACFGDRILNELADVLDGFTGVRGAVGGGGGAGGEELWGVG